MASVNELIAAAEYQKSPLTSGLEGLAQGYLRGQQQELERIKTLVALRQNQEDRRKQEEAQANLRKQLNARQDATYAQRLNASGQAPPPVRPQDMVAKFAEDASGNLSATYTDPKEDVKPLSDLDLEYKQARTDYYKNRAEDVPKQDEERDYKRKERRNSERTRIVDKFNSDPSTRAAQKMTESSNLILDLLKSENPIADNAIPTFMAKASGEVGNLSQEDRKPFGGTNAIVGRLKQAAEQAVNGRLTEENRVFVEGLSKVMMNRARANMIDLAKKRSDQYSRASDFLTRDQIFFTLVPDYEENADKKVSYDEGNVNQNSNTTVPKPVGRWNPKTQKVEFF